MLNQMTGIDVKTQLYQTKAVTRDKISNGQSNFGERIMNSICPLPCHTVLTPVEGCS